jgi:TRAP-type C4-dicarboxylate transport system substrate-binding protein
MMEGKMRKNFSSLLIVSLAALFFFLPYANAKSIKVNVPYIKPVKHELKFGHALSPNSPYDKGANRFAELVEMYQLNK